MNKERFNNLVFILFIILIIFFSAVAFSLSLNPISLATMVDKINDYYNGLYSNIVNQIILGLIAILIFALAIYLIQKRSHYNILNLSVTQKTSFGEAKISLNSLKNLSLKVLKKMEEIKEIRPLISIVKTGGINIDLHLTLKQDVSIPELSEKIQKSLKEYLLEISGIEAKEIKIHIDKIVYENIEK